MNKFPNAASFRDSVTRVGVVCLWTLSLTSCVIRERGVSGPHRYHKPHPMVVREPVVEILPAGARVVWVRGQKYWWHEGFYYRPHPRGFGFLRVEVKY